MRKWHKSLVFFVSIILLSACGQTSSPLPTTDVTAVPTLRAASDPVADVSPSSISDTPVPSQSSEATHSSGSPGDRAVVVIDTAGTGIPIDPRLFGTNLPAWHTPDNISQENILDLSTTLGSTVLRIPGGSWSNAYSWLACETHDEESNTEDGCYWPWASRPTDFINFARETGQEAMWTVSINATSQEAAALVAFFNGEIDDTTSIGVDLQGYDWKTVGHWAQLRADHGNPDPFPIKLWEIGNEVYGGKQDSGGSECFEWGWEDVWTCDGTEYMLGKGEGAERHEGYLEFREAMRAVDPTIMVGAVGVEDPSDWSDWGNEVIREGGENLDFYVIHYYPYSEQPPSAEAILARPQDIWEEIITATNAAFDTYAGGRRVPIAVTEYNLVAFQEIDNDQLMNRATNALFIADMIGQMATYGVTMANQWDLANGRADNGTDYGLIDMGSGRRAPQYYAMLLWSRIGKELLPVESALSAATTMSVYAGWAGDDVYTILAINKTDAPLDVQFQLAAETRAMTVTADVFTAKTLEATEGVFNGNANPNDDLSDAPPFEVGTIEGSLDYTLEPFSITLIRLTP